jgi:hypothetical protein
MKTSKLIAGLLVILGFAACEPEESLPKCPPVNEGDARYMYGVVPCAYESKSNVPDVDEAVEVIVIPSESEEST